MSRPRTGAEGYTSDDYLEESRALRNQVHERMAQYLVTGMSRAKAWRLATGGVGKKSTSGDSANAQRMLDKHPEIGFRVARLQELAAKKVVDSVAVTKGYAIDALTEVVERCMERREVTAKDGTVVGYEFQPNAVIKAIDSMGNLMGWKIQPKAKEGIEQMSDEDLENALREYADEIANRPGPEEESRSDSGGEEAEEAVQLRPVPEAD